MPDPLGRACREPAVPTPFGRLWWPPVGGATAGTWPCGRYVVGIAGARRLRRAGLGSRSILTPAALSAVAALRDVGGRPRRRGRRQ